ncbi:MAG TPA: TetR/AcrR family transcriptional regulator C-terminal domain-containing protein [Acidimicrobiales bacterium]|nr:TetR/AcrR family transcriptional regulator C-terminal domain-containing protein [Acidimicrobiales bacterium]
MTTGVARPERAGAPTPLDRATILSTAVALVDAHGLAALNMRALARELGVGTMSLYHHVPNKDALLDGIVEVLNEEIEIPDLESGSWDERARRMARSLRAVALAHPNCVPLLVTRPFSTAAALRPCEAAFQVLEEAGLGPDRAIVTLRTFVAYVLGFVMMESAGFLSGVGPDRDPEELLELGLPHLAVIASHLADRDINADFDAGLHLVELGLLSWLASGARPAGG